MSAPGTPRYLAGLHCKPLSDGGDDWGGRYAGRGIHSITLMKPYSCRGGHFLWVVVCLAEALARSAQSQDPFGQPKPLKQSNIGSFIAVLLLMHVVPTFGGIILVNGLTQMNGLIALNGLAIVKCLGTVNDLPSVNGLPTLNGIPNISGKMASNPIME
jgi:hypothetical protein